MLTDINDISYLVRGAIFTVHKELGPGLFESVYEAALAYELRCSGLDIVVQFPIPVYYKGIFLEMGFRADIVVNEMLIIEIKSVEMLHPVHKKQLINYLKLTDKRLGILVNFNSAALIDKENLVRIIN